MVGGPPLALCRGELRLVRQTCRRCRDRRPGRQQLQAAVQVERRRVDRVVGARIADETVQVEGLRRAHGTRGGHAGVGGRAHERRRVEGRGRLDPARLRLAGADDGTRRRRPSQNRLHALRSGETPLGVCGLQLLVVRPEHGLDLPIGDRHEGPAHELPVHDQAQRRSQHPPERQVLGANAVGRQRHESREDGAPDEVDVLARARRLGEVEVDGRRLGEGRADLFLRQCRVADADMAVDRHGVHHRPHAQIAVAAGGGERRARLAAARGDRCSASSSSCRACRAGGA